MKEINFQKEKYMSSRRVADLLKVGGGITLYDKHDITKGPELNVSSRHMSIKDFNLQFGDLQDFESRRNHAISQYYGGQGKDYLEPKSQSTRDAQSSDLKNKLKKEDSTLYLDTEIYI